MFSFCHYAQGPGATPAWTVTTYGQLVSTPQNGLTYYVTDITGTRVQTGANPSTTTITGIGPAGQYYNGRNYNDNLFTVAFPFLDYGGLAYQLSASVTLPPNSTGGTVTTDVIQLLNQPPCEGQRPHVEQRWSECTTSDRSPLARLSASVCCTPQRAPARGPTPTTAASHVSPMTP